MNKYSNLRLSQLLVGFLFILSALLLSIESGNCQKSDSSLPSDPLKGRMVFDQKGCIKCHSVHGYGGSIASDLGDKVFFGSALELASIMWNHSPQMSRKMRELQIVQPQFSQKEMTWVVLNGWL